VAETNKKVMVIGLDGATFDLIKPWAEAGELPTLKKLMDGGVHGPLKSTIPFATIPAWPSFATGCNPGKHGFYDSIKERDNGYEWTVELFPSKANKQTTLWDILSHEGWKVAVINVPSTFPPTEVNGYMITGMFTPPGARYTYPPEFQVELERELGRYDIFFSSLFSKNPELLLKDLGVTLDQRIKATLYLWKEKSPDFLFVVDNGTDKAEHEFWRFIDPSNPLYSIEDVRMYGNPLLEYYQKVDAALAEIIELLDKDTTLIVMSDHGQGSLKKFMNLNLFLIQEGFMVIKKETISRLRYFLFNHGYCPRNLYNALTKLGVARFAGERISQRTRLSLLNKLFFSTADINWSKTKAFASGVTGGICLNVIGRQSQGTVKFGSEYETLRDRLIEKLSQLRDPESGNEVVDTVAKREEVYFGPYLDKAPDIILTAKEGYEFFGMYGFSFSKVIETTFGNSGSHRPDGVFMAMGSDIKRGVEIERANIVDLAATILHILSIPIPQYMDGRVLGEIFEAKK